jgi:hypothetical protein
MTMQTSVTIRMARNAEIPTRAATELSNYAAEDLPINDDTQICVAMGEDVDLFVTIGQWQRLVDAVARDVAAIPEHRAKVRERRARISVGN